MSGGGRVPVASSLLSRSMANLDQNERNEALSMLITIGLSHYQQNYGNSLVDMNSLKRLHGKIKPLLPATKNVTIFYSVTVSSSSSSCIPFSTGYFSLLYFYYF